MDSVTQILLGAAVAGVCVPAGHRRKALMVGAALGTLPDLDVLIDYGDAVSNFTQHRGFSHSLLVLVPFAGVLWLTLRRWWRPVREAPMPWFWAIMLVLTTHPLLDAHTAYGTQLLWPLSLPPVSWSTLFIIDPLYTLPLLNAVVVVAFRPLAARARSALMLGLLLSSLYLGWSWGAKITVEAVARDALAGRGLADAPLFVTPTPFNTLLWRVVVLTEEGFLEGLYSLVADTGEMAFGAYGSDVQSLQAAQEVPAVQRLLWFSRGFVKARLEGDLLVLSDLRMGQEPAYVFNHAVAVRGNPHWRAITPQRVPAALDRSRLLGAVWQRIWQPGP